MSTSSLFLTSSYRTRPEQAVGFFIFLLLSFGFLALNYWISNRPLHALEYPIPWILNSWLNVPTWIVYHLLFPFSMWTLWRRMSLLNLKLEASLFVTLLILQTLFFITFFVFQENLLSLFVNLFLFISTFLCIFLFRKKEKISGLLLIPGFLWIFYLMGVSMALCISNP